MINIAAVRAAGDGKDAVHMSYRFHNFVFKFILKFCVDEFRIRNHKGNYSISHHVTYRYLEEAFDRVPVGLQRRNPMSDAERRMTAYDWLVVGFWFCWFWLWSRSRRGGPAWI